MNQIEQKTKRKSAKTMILEILKANEGKLVTTKELDEKCRSTSTDWPRSLRKLRTEDGYGIETVPSAKNSGYILHGLEPKNPRPRDAISNKTRITVIARDKSTCQICGRNVKDDGIKIEIDHIVPVFAGGTSNLSNLRCLCRECNQGKKHYDLEKLAEKESM